MNRNKLDKLVDQIFSEMGKIEKGEKRYVGLLDESGELICYKSPSWFWFVVTDKVPHLNMLRYSLDDKSFKYLMDQVGNRLSDLYDVKKPVSYYRSEGGKYLYNYIQ